MNPYVTNTKNPVAGTKDHDVYTYTVLRYVNF